MTDAPLEAARALVEQTYELLLDARRVRDQLEAMKPSSPADQAERDHALGLALAFEAGLQRTMEEALAMMKQIKGAVSEEWLKRQGRDWSEWHRARPGPSAPRLSTARGASRVRQARGGPLPGRA